MKSQLTNIWFILVIASIFGVSGYLIYTNFVAIEDESSSQIIDEPVIPPQYIDQAVG